MSWTWLHMEVDKVRHLACILLFLPSPLCNSFTSPPYKMDTEVNDSICIYLERSVCVCNCIYVHIPPNMYKG